MRLKFPGLPMLRHTPAAGTDGALSGTNRMQSPRTAATRTGKALSGLIQPEIEGDSINARFLRLIIK